MLRERADYPVIEWRDFMWKKKLLVVRHEVAKQTRARDRLRYVPLETVTIKPLQPLADTGRIIPIARRIFQGLRRDLCKEMRVRWPENCLRNSYATYALATRCVVYSLSNAVENGTSATQRRKRMLIQSKGRSADRMNESCK
jgi:hypothetical protein